MLDNAVKLANFAEEDFASRVAAVVVIMIALKQDDVSCKPVKCVARRDLVFTNASATVKSTLDEVTDVNDVV